MRGAKSFLFNLLTLAVCVGVSLLAAALVPQYPSLAFGVTIVASFYGSIHLRAYLDIRALETRLSPVLEVLKRVGPMASKEKDYQRVLVAQFFSEFSAGLKPESPLPTGTRVDAWMNYDGDDWYITVKRGLSNQQRLCLQGEIEDILLHSPKRGKDLWVVVVLGIPEEPSSEVIGQLNALLDYTINRASEQRTAQKAREVNIEIAPVELSVA